ncbi:MAG: ribonuclease HII [Bryobacteraceae bacterium]
MALDPSFRCRGDFERRVRSRGFAFIAGVDEAGRGCLFGPVFAAAVILSREKPVRGLDDSKKLMAERREVLAARIRDRAVAWSVGRAESDEIDRYNILQAARLAMRRAIEQLAPSPDYLLVDAVTVDIPLPQRALIHGDARSHSIAAASILAKVDRDASMREMDALYPEYGLAQNKGYGTPEHLVALHRYGPTRLHRRSFAPVLACLQISLL